MHVCESLARNSTGHKNVTMTSSAAQAFLLSAGKGPIKAILQNECIHVFHKPVVLRP